MQKKTVFIDMDNVLVDFASGIEKTSGSVLAEYEGRLDEVPGIFSLMTPMPGAIEAVNMIAKYYEVYILSTAPWLNPSAWSDKLKWVHKYFGSDKSSILYKRLILSHHKDLCRGDYLIDDRTKSGADAFSGELILFAGDRFPDWQTITGYLLEKAIPR